jgi:hypothetical protein
MWVFDGDTCNRPTRLRIGIERAEAPELNSPR